MPSQRTLLLAGIAAVALALGILIGRGGFAPPAPRAVTVLPAPRPLPEFVLASGIGHLKSADLRGRWTVVFFGFTHCPDVCPTTLALLANAWRGFADLPAATRPRVLFISVDPARDSPAATLDFAHYFDPAFAGATGDDATLSALTGALGAPFERGTPDAHGEYEVDHSGALFLLDPQGRFAAVMTPPLDGTALGADLRLLMDASR